MQRVVKKCFIVDNSGESKKTRTYEYKYTMKNMTTKC